MGKLTSRGLVLTLGEIDGMQTSVGNGRFRILWPLGEDAEGGQGKVYLGQEGETGAEVAVKVFKRAGEAAHEWQLGQQVSGHENVINMIALDTSLQSDAIVMEKAGQDFFNYAADFFSDGRSTMNAAEVCRWLKQMASGVAHMHSLGVAHLDIKLENMLLVECGGVEKLKLTDFGYSRSILRGERLNVRVGSWKYTAPDVYLSVSYEVQLPEFFVLRDAQRDGKDGVRALCARWRRADMWEQRPPYLRDMPVAGSRQSKEAELAQGGVPYEGRGVERCSFR